MDIMKEYLKRIFIFIVILSIPLVIFLELNNIISISVNEEDANPDINYMGVAPTSGYLQRKKTYLNNFRTSESFYAQAARLYLGVPVYEESFNEALTHVNSYKDTADFRVNFLLRLMYLDRTRHVLSENLKTQIKDTLINFKYWFTEPNEDKMIFWTENHMILFHTCELLVGQLYPDEIFPNSGMTGTEHVNHALPLIIRWLAWRAQLGFAEWHSNIYYTRIIAALVNLVDFAQDSTVATMAAMLLDLVAFDFACNYFKGVYGTTHGRTEDNKKVGESLESPPLPDSTTQSAWIMLGIGEFFPEDTQDKTIIGSIALATSTKYAPPAILERIAARASSNIEHKDRNSIDLIDGPNYEFGYRTENDLMFWWPMSAPAAGDVIDASLELIEKYDLKTKLVYQNDLFVTVLQTGAKLHDISLSEYCKLLGAITEGICLQSVSTYTYRTPYYQLSGAQDYQKGTDGLQEHIWQASLGDNAFVYTNMPGGVSTQEFTGGWKPRATFYKNVGIIQYDREVLPLEGELITLLLGFTPYNHAYFPQWAFDEVVSQGKWTFGAKGGAYIALYSYGPTWWETNHELRASGKKNLWIVELGSSEEHDSFEQFISVISQSNTEITDLPLGYGVSYISPSQGEITVAWNSSMLVKGKPVDLGPYDRFDNEYCHQEFGSKKTIIKYNGQSLVLDFDNIDRKYII